MKLYELPRGSLFSVLDGFDVPPCAPHVQRLSVYRLNNLDGLYSNCTDRDGNTVHIAAYADVRLEDELK